MTQKEINDFNKRVVIMPCETTTYFNYVFYETIIQFTAENDNEISFEVRRAFTAPYMKFGFYMIIGDDPVPLLLSSDAVDSFMLNPYKAEKLALEVSKDRKNYGDAR
ncbi:MAG: hypothetical protein MJ246_03215 [Clostridia bacterium]|nr:hypothetical protein [Clostridia bacterium]